jgi:predicted site-specific integrase-resolvase
MSEEVQPHPKLLKEIDAAERLSIEVSTLRRWRWSGKGPRFLKIGGAVRYHPNDLVEFLSAACRNSTSDTGDSSPKELV